MCENKTLLYILAYLVPFLCGFQDAQLTEFRSQNFFVDVPAIWSHSQPPAKHEIVLFRRAFTLEQEIDQLNLSLFADIRYEVWLDGNWLGRGPARFSHQIHEYDSYAIDHLGAGYHVIAVLVQWAPEGRRSDSVTPYLQANLVTDGFMDMPDTILTTDTEWVAWPAHAWRWDTQWLHSLHNLIGPTELLDFSQMPAGWAAMRYNQDHWPHAVIKETPVVETIRPRSIPQLVNLHAPFTLYDQGQLSPGYTIHELLPTDQTTYTMTVDAPLDTASNIFSLEVLASETVSPIRDVHIVGTPIVWQSLDKTRPDVFSGKAQLSQGTHTLSMTTMPETGFTLALGDRTSGIPLETSLPGMHQGLHSGRRNLLAEFIPEEVAVLDATGTITQTDIMFTESPAYLVLDLGRVRHGRITALATGPADTIIDIGWDERLWEAGSMPRPLVYHGRLNPGWNQTDSWVLDGTEQRLTTIDSRAGRYVLITVWSPTMNKSNLALTLHDFQILEEGYPSNPIGSLKSPEPLLNQIWQTGVDTLYANMTDGYADPLRERGQWWGDAFVAYHMNRVAFGDQLLVRRGIRFFPEYMEAANGLPAAFAPGFDNVSRPHDYGMLWVISAHQYVQLTEDHDLLREIYPAMVAFMSHLETLQNPVTGLIEMPVVHWHGSAVIGWGIYYSRWGQSTVMNSFYHATLQAAAQVATSLGDDVQASAWQVNADNIVEQLNSVLYLPDKGYYAVTLLDDILQENETICRRPQAQAWPLAYDLVPSDLVDRIADAAVDTTSINPGCPILQIYEMFWLLEALGKANRLSEALTIIRTRYGELLDSGATTWWEGFGANYSYRASLSHAWGGAPTWFLSTYVLGARQLSPTRWEVTPGFASGLREMDGAIPISPAISQLWTEPAKKLEVTWQQTICLENSRQRFVTIDAPSATEGILRLADLTSATEILLDQKVIWQSGVAQSDVVVGNGGDVEIILTEGHYEVVILEHCHTLFLPLISKNLERLS